MSEHIRPSASPAEIVPSVSGITLTQKQREVSVYNVMDSELTMLRNSSPASPISFLTLCIGLAVGFGTTFFTVDLTDREHAIFGTMLLGTTVLSAYFAVTSLKAKKANDELVNSIRERPSI